MSGGVKMYCSDHMVHIFLHIDSLNYFSVSICQYMLIPTNEKDANVWRLNVGISICNLLYRTALWILESTCVMVASR